MIIPEGTARTRIIDLPGGWFVSLSFTGLCAGALLELGAIFSCAGLVLSFSVKMHFLFISLLLIGSSAAAEQKVSVDGYCLSL